jgi:ribosomal protein S18
LFRIIVDHQAKKEPTMMSSLVRLSRQFVSKGSLESLLCVTYTKRSQKAPLIANAQRCWITDGGSSKKGGDADGNEQNTPKASVDDIDFFGVNENDGPEGLGQVPDLRQERQFARIAGQLSAADKRILSASNEDHETQMLNRLQEHWTLAAKSKDPNDDPLNQAGQRVRETEAALTRLGRSPAVANETIDEKTEIPSYDLLSEKEFSAFSKYVQEHRDMPPLTRDDIPTQEPKSKMPRYRNKVEEEEDELASKWLTARAAREMDDGVDDNPYADTMPGDMSPSNLVNRRRAKRIPTEQVHHQNLYLLQTFLDPVTALIRPRVQTRLGARDQRKIAKMVKRSRALGLIPNVGQFKVERTGWIHDPDINSKRPWEVELEKAGLKLPLVTAEQMKESKEETWK